MSETRDPGGRRLSEAIDRHIQALGWSQQSLAEASGLSASLISEWKKGRTAKPEHVQRVAVAIALGYDALRAAYADRAGQRALTDLPGLASEVGWVRNALPRVSLPVSGAALGGGAGKGGSTVEDEGEAVARCGGSADVLRLLEEFMGAVGYWSPPAARDGVFNQLRARERKDRRIKVGFFEWPGLAARSAGGKEETWTGFSHALTALVTSLIGVRFEAVGVEWPHVHRALENGDVNLIAPVFLRAPMRMFRLRFSTPIPHVSCKLCAVCSKAGLERMRREDPALVEALESDAGPSPEQWARVRWIVGESEITDALARLLGPGCPESSFEPRQGAGKFGSIEEGMRLAVESERGGRRGAPLWLFPTELVSVSALRTRERGMGWVEDLGVLPGLRGGGAAATRLPIAFGVGLEEPRFLELIDAALDVLRGDDRAVAALARAVPSEAQFYDGPEGERRARARARP